MVSAHGVGLGSTGFVRRQILGHSSVAVTMSIYAHVVPGDQAKAVREMESVLAG